MSNRPPPALPSLGAALAWARRLLTSSDSGPLEAAVLLARLIGRNRAYVLAHPEEAFPRSLWREYRQRVARCAAGEPLAYLTGEQEFFGLAMIVTPAVLVPRPETERLVELALAALAARRAERPAARLLAADVGTGSGCIASVLVHRTVGLFLVASDISTSALAVAGQNVARHAAAGRASLIQADLMTPLRGPFDIVCANLPYIPSETLAGLPVSRHEPLNALDGGPDGFAFIEKLLRQLPPRLAPGGTALLEIAAGQGETALHLAWRLLPHAEHRLHKDAAGIDRVLEVRFPSA